jgi:hypothetical protein
MFVPDTRKAIADADDCEHADREIAIMSVQLQEEEDYAELPRNIKTPHS